MSAQALSIYTLIHRELVRFFRQKSRWMSALGAPLIFWFFLGSGVGDSFGGNSYLQFFFPGTIALTVLFTSIFASISVIQDRQEGFLQSVLVAPVSQQSIVAGKVLGGTLLALIQGSLLVFLAPLVGYSLTLMGCVYLFLGLSLLSFGMSAIGFYFAWKLDSVQGFHGLMNALLMPMWLLSGALFPFESAPTWMKWVMYLNPMTYGVSALRHAFYWGDTQAAPQGPDLMLSLGILVVSGLFFYFAAVFLTHRSRRG